MAVCLHAELALGLCHQPFDFGRAWTPRATLSVTHNVSVWLRRVRDEMGRLFVFQTYLLGLLLRRGPSFDVNVQVLNEGVSLRLPA